MLFYLGLAALPALLLAAFVWRRFFNALTSLATLLAAVLGMLWLFDNGYWPQDRPANVYAPTPMSNGGTRSP